MGAQDALQFVVGLDPSQLCVDACVDAYCLANDSAQRFRCLLVAGVSILRISLLLFVAVQFLGFGLKTRCAKVKCQMPVSYLENK